MLTNLQNTRDTKYTKDTKYLIFKYGCKQIFSYLRDTKGTITHHDLKIHVLIEVDTKDTSATLTILPIITVLLQISAAFECFSHVMYANNLSCIRSTSHQCGYFCVSGNHSFV